MSFVELLKKSPLFQSLNVKETNLLGSICKTEKYPAGATIIEENTNGRALFIIKSGEVKVSKIDESGKERAIGMLSPGEHFGEMALIEDQHTSARIVADVDVELLTISRADLVKLLENTPELAAKIYYSICKTLSERLRRADTYSLLLQ